MNFRFIPCTWTSISLDYMWDILLKQDNSTKRSIAFFHLSLSFTDFLLRNQFVFLIFFHCGFHLVIAFGEEGSYPIIQPYANKEQRNCGFCKYLRTMFRRNFIVIICMSWKMSNAIKVIVSLYFLMMMTMIHYGVVIIIAHKYWITYLNTVLVVSLNLISHYKVWLWSHN